MVLCCCLNAHSMALQACGARLYSSVPRRPSSDLLPFSAQGGRKLADWGEKPRDVATGGAAAVRDEDGEVQAAIAASLADAPAAGAALFPSHNQSQR